VTASRRGRAPKRRSGAAKIRDRLHEAEATLEAIRTGRVDALVVAGPQGEQTLTIQGGTHPYFVLLDAMSDGAALLTPNGEILFANRSLGAMTGVGAEALRGTVLGRLVIPADRKAVGDLMVEGARRAASHEFSLERGAEATTPVAIAVSPISLDTTLEPGAPDARNGDAVLMAVFSDLTYTQAVEATRARLLERLISAEDEERRRIARELHDEAGQSLAAITVGLRAIADMGVSASVRSAVLRLRDVTSHTVDDIGRLARGLHPAVLDDKGLAAAARRYVADYARAFDAKVDVSVGRVDSPRLPPLTAATMYRILQECLTNVTRHARAKRAAVELRRDDRTIELVVRDDGVGFETGRGSDMGLGLRGMRERVALSGGTIEVASRPGHGTTVRVRLPADRGVRRAVRP
jgi:signal transduction histidine kinase